MNKFSDQEELVLIPLRGALLERMDKNQVTVNAALADLTSTFQHGALVYDRLKAGHHAR